MGEINKDFLQYVSNNKSVHDLYERLAELEINNQQDSDRYMLLKELLKDQVDKCDNFFKKYADKTDELNMILTQVYELDRVGEYDFYGYHLYYPYNFYKKANSHSYEIIYESGHSILDSSDLKELGIMYQGKLYPKQEALDFIEEEQGEEMRDQIEEFLDEPQDETSPLYSDYYYYSIQLETHIFMSYLIDAIANENNPEIKSELIKAKYAIIESFKALETSFLYESNPIYLMEYYTSVLMNIMRADVGIYEYDITEKKKAIKEKQDILLERKKKEYNNTQEIVQDILLNIYLKTILSSILNDQERSKAIEDFKVAEKMVTSPIDKKTLKKARELKKEYIVQCNQ